VAVVVSMLRGVNLGPHRRVSMEALRALYLSLGLRDVQTYIQSGNIIFTTSARDLAALGKRIETAIEKKFGFHSEVILRTGAELGDVLERNPFAARPGIDPSRVLISFLSRHPELEAAARLAALKTSPEELFLDGRELYIYYPNGMGRSKLTMTLLDKSLGVAGTGRNWNTVRKLRELVVTLEH
jgi:uncharacterized protein (DUF1697 family)